MVRVRNNEALLWSILGIAFVQMTHLAIVPGFDAAVLQVFAIDVRRALEVAALMPYICAILGGIVAVVLVRNDVASRRTIVLAGLGLAALSGVSALLLNTRVWHLFAMNSLLGFGIGLFVPVVQSLVFDCFDVNKRRVLCGMQFALSCFGCILLGIIAGVLELHLWYGGHLIALVIVSVAVITFLLLPKEIQHFAGGRSGESARLPGGVYYFAVMTFLFATLFNVVGVDKAAKLAEASLAGGEAAGHALMLMLLGGVFGGVLFSKISQVLGDDILPVSFLLMLVGFAFVRYFPDSPVAAVAAMLVFGCSFGIFVPRCVFGVSNLVCASDSTLAAMLVSCAAPAAAGVVSPYITRAFSAGVVGDAGGYFFGFAAVACPVLAGVAFVKNRYDMVRAPNALCAVID
ncbi:MAG: hypothetical protein FWH33_01445 [Oscillospiraceae bacterium]|nr:hypothetical protein [Oscillospiraceae bacterium]